MSELHGIQSRSLLPRIEQGHMSYVAQHITFCTESSSNCQQK